MKTADELLSTALGADVAERVEAAHSVAEASTMVFSIAGSLAAYLALIESESRTLEEEKI